MFKTNKILILSIFLAFATFVYLEFLESEEFESQMIIKVVEPNEGLKNISVLPLDSLRDRSSSSVQLKSYLESNEGINRTLSFALEVMQEKNALLPGMLDIRRYLYDKDELLNSLRDIKIIDGSDLIEIRSRAFTPTQSRILNISLINISRNFFDSLNKTTANVDYANNICVYSFLQNNSVNDFNLNEAAIDLLKKNPSINTTELIAKIYDDYRKNCLETQGTSIQNALIGIPVKILDNIDSETKASILQEIFKNLNASIENSNKIQIIAEPSIDYEELSKGSIIISIIVFIASILILISVQSFIVLIRDYS